MLFQQAPAADEQSERRAMRRFSMKLPASVRVSGIPSAFSVETENVSARDLFLH
jgi:hypothetical protein